MTEEITNHEPTPVEAIREALQAAREALKICQKLDDPQGTIKSARAIGDLSARLARVGEEAEKSEDRPFRSKLIEEIIGLIENGPCETCPACREQRQHQAESIRLGEETRERTLNGG